MITSVIFSLNKILMNTNDCGAIHLKVICFEHSFEIIPCIIHPFPEHSSSICQLVTEGHPRPEAMFVNLGNLSRFVFHKVVWSFLVLISAGSCGYAFLSLNPNCMRSQLFFFLTSAQPRSLMFLRSFFQKSSDKSISLLHSTQNFINFLMFCLHSPKLMMASLLHMFDNFCCLLNLLQ